MSQQQPLPSFSYLNEGDSEALNQLLGEIEPAMMVNMLKELFRGWLASTYVEEKEVDERADLYFTFERMLAFCETLDQNNLTAVKTIIKTHG